MSTTITRHPDALRWAREVGEDTDGHRRELDHGEVVVTPPPTIRHQRICQRVASALSYGPFQEPHYDVLQAAGVLVHTDTLVIPDVVVHVGRAPDEATMEVQDVALVVEVLSPSTRAYDLTAKAMLYANAHVALWIFDPVTETVSEYSDGRVVALFQNRDIVHGMILGDDVTLGPAASFFA